MFVALFDAAIPTIGQDFNLYQKKWTVQGGDTLPYRVLYPLNLHSTKTYAVLFFLHDAGERGNDNERQLTQGVKIFFAR